ncbi:DUF2092 domain-containing protein [Fundidesulfovibrio agrisoli]|uniref:DUF2092 domain-containing protein n=1 Tax=Fundidesulfovibrio agrisoli TaxID=2922717 RepID=UPI001FAC743C|nr:DUF2092 domain-containing protein [Fundidesulfovibrio agrisoli]
MSFPARIRMGIAALALAALLPGLAAAAGTADQGKPKDVQSRLEPQALDVLEKSCKALSALKEFSFHADVALDKVYEDGSKVQYSRVMQISVRRPDAFRVVTSGDDIKAASFFDGKTFTVLQPEKKIWSQIPAEMTIDAVLDRLADVYGLESPLGDLIVSQPCARLKMTAAIHVGKAVVNHVVCDHLFFQAPGADWQLWVPENGPALPAKMLITDKTLPNDPQFQATFSAWKEKPIPAKTFAFTAPEGTTRDDALFTPAASKPAGKAKSRAAAKAVN